MPTEDIMSRKSRLEMPPKEKAPPVAPRTVKAATPEVEPRPPEESSKFDNPSDVSDESDEAVSELFGRHNVTDGVWRDEFVQLLDDVACEDMAVAFDLVASAVARSVKHLRPVPPRYTSPAEVFVVALKGKDVVKPDLERIATPPPDLLDLSKCVKESILVERGALSSVDPQKIVAPLSGSLNLDSIRVTKADPYRLVLYNATLLAFATALRVVIPTGRALALRHDTAAVVRRVAPGRRTNDALGRTDRILAPIIVLLTSIEFPFPSRVLREILTF
jgi:hypothetical protein